MPYPSYAQEIHAWRAALDNEIRGDRGPLALSGLHWLQEGINTIGASRDCSICLPQLTSRLLGVFELASGQVTFRPDIGQMVEIDGAPVQTACILRSGEDEGGSRLRSGDISRELMRHAGQLGVRLWDA